jgi:REP element-mobilizing transposase RayT
MRSRNRQYYEKFGDIFFITSTVAGFIDLFQSEAICEIFINSLRFCQSRGDFTIIGYVLMPNHFHLLVKAKPDGSISAIIGNIKRFTSRSITKYLESTHQIDLLDKLARAASGEPADDSRIWKPRFDCFVLTNEDTVRQKLEYIHFNPVRRNLTDDSIGWRYSSARNYAGLSDVPLEVDINWESLGYIRIPSENPPEAD